MNKNIILVIILSLTLTLNISVTQAAPAVGSGFTYQGELIDNGSPANGDYEVTLELFLQLSGGSPAGFTSLTFAPVTVTNGLFSIDNVDFGDMVYADNGQFYIEVAVKEVGAASFDILTPRQRLSAVPYAVQAEFLAAGAATNGDILQFNGSDWVAAATSGLTLWQSGSFNSVYHDAGRVGIGTNSPNHTLDVVSSNSSIASFDGTNNSSVFFNESGGVRGYIGSRSTTANDEDFQIGTAFSNWEGDMHLTIRYEPKLTINEDTGRVGVGTTTPNSTLHVRSEPGDDPFRVQVQSSTKLKVSTNGGMVIGTNGSPPENGLYVHGDAKQHRDANGLLKYMVEFYCAHDVPTATIVRYVNNINSTPVDIVPGFDVGQCILNFPTDITQRYWQVSAITRSGTQAHNIGANCRRNGTHGIFCSGVKLSNGNRSRTSMMLLVY